MRQALLNILTTALDWMPEGRLVIRAENLAAERKIQLSIAGCSSLVSPTEMEDERLQVAYELVEFSDGQLEVSSDGEADAAFVFRLTLLADNQITVLAIDDNPDTLQLLQRYTAGTRYRLAGESDPGQCMAVAEASLPDIILLDVMLQDVDGWELLGRFRAHPQLGDRPVIVCTISAARRTGTKPGRRRFLEQAPQSAAALVRPRCSG